MTTPDEPDRDLYDVALQVTDEALGAGAYARLNAEHPDPGVQAAIDRAAARATTSGTRAPDGGRS